MDEVKQENLDSMVSSVGHEPLATKRDRLTRGRRDFLKSILVGVPALAAACSAEGGAITTDTAPTLSPNQQVQTGSGKFIEGDKSLNDSLKDLLQSSYHVELPDGSSTPFSIDVEGASFDFIAVAPLEFKGWNLSWNEKIFMRVGNTLADLDRREVDIDNNQLVVWSYINKEGGPEPVLWYPKITEEQWQNMTQGQKNDFYAGFAPPSPLEKNVTSYSRETNVVFAISFGRLPEKVDQILTSQISYHVPAPTQEPTPQPEPTTQREIKQFNVCSIENFKDCQISVSDLLNGDYLRWLTTLSKPFTNPQELTPLSSETKIGNHYYFGKMDHNRIDLNDPEKSPIRRGVTAAYINSDWDGYDYAVLPVEVYNPKDPSGSSWIITIVDDIKGAQQIGALPFLKKWPRSSSLAIYTDDVYDYDPLLIASKKVHTDIAQRITKFVKSGDPTGVSVPGIILKTHIGQD